MPVAGALELNLKEIRKEKDEKIESFLGDGREIRAYFIFEGIPIVL